MKTSFPTITAAVLLAVLVAPGALQAHEGHGFEATIQSVLHWLSSPVHLATVVAGVVFVAGVTAIALRLLRPVAEVKPRDSIQSVEG